MSRIRSKTVEPVIGTLVNFTNMKRVNTRGIKNANKHVLMASLTYNLKKYLRFTIRKPSVLAQVISLKQGKYFAFVKSAFTETAFTFSVRMARFGLLKLRLILLSSKN